VGGGGVEGCERAEDAFGHGGAADVAEADEEDGDFFGGGVGHCWVVVVVVVLVVVVVFSGWVCVWIWGGDG
jgi:hypothetical protein